MSNNALVTVLMPVYNAEKYLKEAIDSILNQTYKDFIFLIINDGSTDSSEEIILSYKDHRIKYLKNEKNLRLVATLNKGLDIIDTKYMLRMDADDVSHPQRIEKLVEFMEDNADIGVCGSYIKTFGNDNAVWKYETTDEYIRPCILYKSMMPHAASIIRMSILNNNTIRYKEKFIHIEDALLWYKLFGLTRFANIPEPLYNYRIIPESVTNLNRNSFEERVLRFFEFFYREMIFPLDKEELKILLCYDKNKNAKFSSFAQLKIILRKIKKFNSLNQLFAEKALNYHFNIIRNNYFYKIANNNFFLAIYVLMHCDRKIQKLTYLLLNVINKIKK